LRRRATHSWKAIHRARPRLVGRGGAPGGGSVFGLRPRAWV
jgi:hypothetical protein